MIIEPKSNFLFYKAENLLMSLAFNPLKSDKIIEREYKSIVEQLGSNRILVISYLWEPVDTSKSKQPLEHLTAKLKEAIPDLKIIQIANSWYCNQNIKLANTDAIHYFDFFLLRVFYKIIIQKESMPATKWNSHATQFLFLTGKPYKFNRIRLLYKLVKEGLINRAIWSFNCQTDEEIKKNEIYVNELTPAELTEFIKKYTNLPDKYFSPTGIPFETSLYENKLFNVISETHFDRLWIAPWITEKTWLTTVNRLPFIVAGEHKTTARLNTLGFKTFNEYLAIPNYDNPDSSDYLNYPLAEGIQGDCELRLLGIIQNVKCWLANINKFQQQIELDIETNYDRFIELGQLNYELVKTVETTYGLDSSLIEKMVAQKED